MVIHPRTDDVPAIDAEDDAATYLEQHAAPFVLDLLALCDNLDGDADAELPGH